MISRQQHYCSGNQTKYYQMAHAKLLIILKYSLKTSVRNCSDTLVVVFNCVDTLPVFSYTHVFVTLTVFATAVTLFQCSQLTLFQCLVLTLFQCLVITPMFGHSSSVRLCWHSSSVSLQPCLDTLIQWLTVLDTLPVFSIFIYFLKRREHLLW